MDGENEFIPLSPDRVKEIVSMNQQKKKPHTLKDFMIQETVVAEIAYENVVGQDSLSRFDDNFGNKKKNKPTRNPNQRPGNGNPNQQQPNQNRQPRVEREPKTVELTVDSDAIQSIQQGENPQKNRNNNNKRRNNNRRNFDKNKNQNRPDSNNANNE